MIERISFGTFFLATKDNLNLDLLRVLNPDIMTFLKDKDVYYATSPTKDGIDVNMVVGRGFSQSIVNFIRECLQIGITKAKFATKPSNTIINRFAEKAGATRVQFIKNYYASGDDLIVYEIDGTNEKVTEMLGKV